ncbi:hypothetical protein PoB_002852600 [Plakobranchus ocellatus]|uniref:Uncharacterized protein n=1 Tax=Plakobranchus ocellatus TaxID=259542 RepID=A0AAV3ZSK6_9GAST|nr:hypothetical protein PoB_002852600 [Plakobranchus ocellatus]
MHSTQHENKRTNDNKATGENICLLTGLPLDIGLPLGVGSASGRRVCLWTQGLPLDVGQGCTQQFRTVPPTVVRQLAHVSTVSSPVRHTVTTWSLSHQAPVLVCVPSMSRHGWM